jgi:TRAP transporter TAXI family solute receptor
MKRNYLFLILLILLSVNIYGYGELENKEKVLMGSSSMGGTWYPTACALAGEVMRYSDSIITVQTSGGGVENIRLMIDGNYQMALVEPNTAYYAVNGEYMFKDKKYEGLRYIANLYPNIYHCVVMKNSKYETYYDLKKSRKIKFSPGTAGSGDEYSWEEVFSVHDIGIDDVQWRPLSHTERSMAFKDRVLDCVGYFTACPSGSILEASAQNPIRLLQIGKKEAEEVMKKYPWNFEFTIPAGTYNGQDKDVHTLGAGTFVMVDESVSDEFAYNLVNIMFGKGLERLRSISSMTQMINIDSAFDGNENQDLPIHPGALKYYKEIGVIN